MMISLLNSVRCEYVINYKDNLIATSSRKISFAKNLKKKQNHFYTNHKEVLLPHYPIIKKKNYNVTKCAPPPVWNPQNVPDPQIMPNPNFSIKETVQVQLDSLKNNNKPWTNHGIQTLYEFAEDAGAMERSRYFGFSKDLYHFDHFLGGFLNAFPELINHEISNIGNIGDVDVNLKSVKVTVENSKMQKIVDFDFLIVMRTFGLKKGCWMTKAIHKLNT